MLGCHHLTVVLFSPVTELGTQNAPKKGAVWPYIKLHFLDWQKFVYDFLVFYHRPYMFHTPVGPILRDVDHFYVVSLKYLFGAREYGLQKA